jgi:hypothetical protein
VHRNKPKIRLSLKSTPVPIVSQNRNNLKNAPLKECLQRKASHKKSIRINEMGMAPHPAPPWSPVPKRLCLSPVPWLADQVGCAANGIPFRHCIRKRKALCKVSERRCPSGKQKPESRKPLPESHYRKGKKGLSFLCFLPSFLLSVVAFPLCGHIREG